MPEYQWWEWGSLAILLFVLGIALKFVVNLNPTEWKRERTERLKEALMVHCPHVEIRPVEDGLEVECLITSPPMSSLYQCRRCGRTSRDGRIMSEVQEYYAKYPKQYLKQMKKHSKIVRKLYG